MSQLGTTLRSTPDECVLLVEGELDHHTAAELQDAVTAIELTGGQRLVLDVAGLRFCDSSGLAVFLAARGHAVDAGATIVLAGVPAHMNRILRITGLDKVLPVEPSRTRDQGDPSPG
jgi:anti-sigma B factor antagonist